MKERSSAKPLRLDGQRTERDNRFASLDCTRTRHAKVKAGSGAPTPAPVAFLNPTGATAQIAYLSAPPFSPTHRTGIHCGFGDRLSDDLCVSFTVRSI